MIGRIEIGVIVVTFISIIIFHILIGFKQFKKQKTGLTIKDFLKIAVGFVIYSSVYSFLRPQPIWFNIHFLTVIFLLLNFFKSYIISAFASLATIGPILNVPQMMVSLRGKACIGS